MKEQLTAGQPAIIIGKGMAVGKSSSFLLCGVSKAEEEQRRRLKEAEERRIDSLLSHEDLFRFAYVPFVICKLVWEYAETVLDLAALMRISETKPLCRAVRELWREYDRIRAPYIDREHQAGEEANSLVFETCVKEIVDQMLLNIRVDLRCEYPDLRDDWVEFLVAVYQCDITLKALLLYCDRQAARLAKILNRRVGHILPAPVYKLDKLILEFTGDKPVSGNFDTLKKQYIQTLATQMALIELNELPETPGE